MNTKLINSLAVEIHGDGPVVVCIHGLGGTSNTWTPVLPALQGHRVVRIDLPGSGRSAAAASGGAGSLGIAQMVEAVAGVCRELDITQATFLGHSMGTIVCLHLAQQPGLVSRLALFGPLACPPEAARPSIRARAEKAAAGGLAAMQEIADAIVQGATSKDTKAHQPVTLALVRESLMRQSAEGYARSCEALAEAQAAALERIEAPALLVTGDEDAVAPPQAVRALAARLPQARVAVLPRCGHWTPVERPEECRRELREFLAALR